MQKCDSTWFENGNSWIVSNYKQVTDFNLLDTVFTNSLNFTKSNISIARLYISGWSEYPVLIQGEDLVSKRYFYIVSRSDNILVWIKIEILSYSSLVIWEYGYSDSDDSIIIGSQ